MRVPRYNYAHQIGHDLDRLERDLKRMLLEGRYVLSSEVRAFEAAFAAYLGANHVRGVNTGTDALQIAFRALGIGVGDRVVTQANTFHATVAAILLVGAKPVLVDVDESTFSIDPRRLESVSSPTARAIVPVHLFGTSAPMAAISDFARKHRVLVIEDAAQAVGARWKGQRVGTIGDVGCFSFHPSKNLAAAGDAGAVVCADPDVDEALRCFRELGQVGQNNHTVVGLNSKIDAIQARILLAKLPLLDSWNAARREIAEAYRERLVGLPLSFQQSQSDSDHVFHLFQVRSKRRDGLLGTLRKSGIDAVVRYPVPIHLQRAFEGLGWNKGQFPVSETLADELLCLPIRPDMTIDEVDIVCDIIRQFFGG